MARRDRISRRLKVRDLHMIEAIASRGSMARAAEDLGLSQPAISKAIADLERDLGAAVFDRSTRGVQLTESGQVLLRRGRVILDELRHGLDEIENISDPTTGSYVSGSAWRSHCSFLRSSNARRAAIRKSNSAWSCQTR